MHAVSIGAEPLMGRVVVTEDIYSGREGGGAREAGRGKGGGAREEQPRGPRSSPAKAGAEAGRLQAAGRDQEAARQAPR